MKSKSEMKRVGMQDISKLAEELFKTKINLQKAVDALEKIGCNEAFHRLGGIDDCPRCLALKEIKGDDK